MPFTKESAKILGKKGGEAPKAKTEAWNNILGWLVGDGGDTYRKCLANQAQGVDLTDAEKEFMDRFEGLLEYHQPKLARNIGTQQIDHTVTFKWDGDNNTV